METLTIVLQEPPYTENNRAWHALRLAGASMAEGMAVRLFLLEKGVEIARRGRHPPEDKLIQGVKRGSMKSLAAWVHSSTHVLSF